MESIGSDAAPHFDDRARWGIIPHPLMPRIATIRPGKARLRLLLAAVLALAATVAAPTSARAGRERSTSRDPAAIEAESALLQGDLKTALEVLNRAIAANPKALYYAMRGGVRGEMHDLKGSVADLNQAIALDATLAVAYLDRGTAWVALGDANRARADLDKAIKLDAESARAWAARAHLNVLTGTWDTAIADATQALKINPRLLQALDSRAEAYYRKGQWKEALADLGTATKVQPRQPVAFLKRAQIFRNIGDLDAALAEANRAVQLDSNSANAYTERATIRGARGQLTEAISDCSTALLVDEQHDYALMLRSILYMQNGEYFRSQEDLETALQRSSIRARAARDLAWLLSTCPEKDVRDGRRALDLALNLVADEKTRTATAYDALAAAHAEVGDFPAAVVAAESALKAGAGASASETEARNVRLRKYHNRQPHRLIAINAGPTDGRLKAARGMLAIGDYRAARDLLDEAVRSTTNPLPEIVRELSWLLATCPLESIRDGERAMQLARSLVDETGDRSAEAMDVYAAACAEIRDFSSAVTAAEQAVKAAGEDPKARGPRQDRTELFRRELPFRTEPPTSPQPPTR